MHQKCSNESEMGLQAIVNSLPPNHDKKSLHEELEEISVLRSPGDQEEDGAGATLSKTQSRVSVLASKARLIGLVLTLTGASFLNASQLFQLLVYMITHDSHESIDLLGPGRRNHPSHNLLRPLHPCRTPTMGHLILLAHFRLLPPPLGTSRRRLRSSSGFHPGFSSCHCLYLGNPFRSR